MAEGTADAVKIGETVFGDSDHLDAPSDPASINCLGRPYIQRDGSGQVVFDSYDFKGNVLLTTQRLAEDYKDLTDWTDDPEDVLEDESFETQYVYDALNRVIAKTTPDNSEYLPTYNRAGFLETVSVKLRGDSTATEFVENIDYNARGQRVKIENGNNTETEYEYDPMTFRLTKLTTTRTSDSKVLQDLTYTYDPAGNIESTIDGVQKTTFFDNTVVSPDREFAYDALYRLIQAKGREHPGQQPNDADYPRATGIPHPNDPALRRYTEYYSYDEIGNILQMRHANGSDVWKRRYLTAEDSNRLTATSLPGDDPDEYSAEYSHDAHGNMTAMPHLALMEWDTLDRLHVTSAGATGQPKTYYVYDAAGQRARKVTENEYGVKTKERIYIGDYEVYREYVASDLDKERESLHVMDDPSGTSGRAKQRIAMVETLTIEEGDPVTTPTPLQRYQLSNHLGSASIELNDDAEVITYEEYYPFGGTSFHSENGTVSQKRYRYNGKEKDDETGLYYYGARYYAPWICRWTACDPAGLADGVNVYIYTRDNPVTLFDPQGTQTTGIEIPLNDVETPQQEEEPPPHSPEELREAERVMMQGFSEWYRSGERLLEERAPREPEMRAITAEEAIESERRAKEVHAQQQAEARMREETAANVYGSFFGALLYTEVLLINPEDIKMQWAASQFGAAYEGIALAGAATPRPIKAQPRIDFEASKISTLGAPKMAASHAKGLLGEEIAGFRKNTKRIDSLSGKTTYRVPDMLDEKAGIIGEVKNVNYLSYTNQLQDDVLFAKQRGFRFELLVRKDTKLSGPLQEAVNSHDIILKRDLP